MIRNPYDKKKSALKFVRDLAIYLFYIIISVANSNIKRSWKFEKEKKRKTTLKAVIIAGGPSFTSKMAEFLIANRSNYEIFAMNFYCLSQFSQKLIPDYYIISDPYFIGDSRYEGDSGRVELLINYIKINNIKMICPDSKKWRKQYDFANLKFCENEALFTKNIKPWLPRGYKSNTTFKAIAIALFFEYDQIFLFGFNYNYPNNLRVSKDGRVYILNEHHYSSNIRYMDHVFEDVSHALRWWADDYYHLKAFGEFKCIHNVCDSTLVDAFKIIGFDEFKRI